jgi:DNA-binding CsgD family transcriptional regulator
VRIDAALAELAPGGPGRAILVQGDAGSGRTALIQAALTLAARRSIPVLALAGRLGDAAPGAVPTSKPLLVTADDADLAGPATRRALAAVAARIPSAPVLLLASSSLAGLDPETVRLLDVPGTERLVLGDVSREATAELLRARLGDAPEPALVDAVHAATRGTPAVAAAVTLDVHCHVQAGATWTAGRLGRLGTAALLAWLQRHVGGPDTPAARLAFAAAIAGPQFDAIDAMRIADLAGDEAGAAYDLLVDRGLVRGPMGASRFRHPVVPLALERALGVSLRATLNARAAAVLHAAGEPAVDVARQLLHAVPTGEPWRVQVLLAAVEELPEWGTADEAQAFARRARAERGAAPEPAASADAADRSVILAAALATFLDGGDVEPIARIVLEALDGGLAATDPHALAVAAPLAASGRLPEAERHLAEVEAAATTAAAHDTAVAAAGARAMVLLTRGRLDDALRCARGALAAADAAEAGGRGFAHAAVARVLLRLGQLDAAAAELACTTARDPATSLERAALAEAAAELALARDDPLAAADHAFACGRLLEQCRADHPGVTRWRSLAVRALAELRRTAEAQALAETDLRLARAAGAQAAISRALAARAIVGDPAVRPCRLAAAAGLLAGEHAKDDRMALLLEHGDALRRAGHRAEARAVLRDALEFAEEAGAELIAARARDALIAARERVDRPASRGVAALTVSERKVARLAAQGLSNREIAEQLWVTVKTVELHLTSTYKKLDLRSRRELARVLGADDAPDLVAVA